MARRGKMEKTRYEIDPHNRLVINGSGGKGSLPRFRRVIDGRFKTDENNDLTYLIRTPLPEDARMPYQVKLRGEWSLTDDYNLRLTLDKSGRETFGDQITLQGNIFDANENSLLFAVATKTKEGTRSTYIINLSGSWKADENNRLSFHIRKEKGAYDILTLNGVWEINKNHQIIYQYEKAKLIRKKKGVHTLTFKGYWDVKDALRISYVLSGGTDSVFEFRADAGVFKEDYIKYDIGIGLTDRRRPAAKTITLFGAWSLKRNVGLIFEIEYEAKKTHAIVFGADAKLTGKDTISFRLKNDIENRDIGVNLELSHEMLKGDGEAFLRVLASRRETAIYAGAAWRW